uniref:Putative ovule protein n=1 Tax=Solanum chacoense TaxID=4108 RepID=A0A0V0GQJ2_SOLCH
MVSPGDIIQMFYKWRDGKTPKTSRKIHNSIPLTIFWVLPNEITRDVLKEKKPVHQLKYNCLYFFVCMVQK